jgi:hypothetical protein
MVMSGSWQALLSLRSRPSLWLWFLRFSFSYGGVRRSRGGSHGRRLRRTSSTA